MQKNSGGVGEARNALPFSQVRSAHPTNPAVCMQMSMRLPRNYLGKEWLGRRCECGLPSNLTKNLLSLHLLGIKILIFVISAILVGM